MDRLNQPIHSAYLQHQALGGLGDGLEHGPRQVVVGAAFVGRGAVVAYLSLAAGEHVDLAHLDDGEDELVEKGGLVDGEPGDGGLGPGVGVQVLVGGEEALAVEQVDVVLVVEDVGGADVVVGGVVGVERRAGEPELRREELVQGDVVLREEALARGRRCSARCRACARRRARRGRWRPG